MRKTPFGPIFVAFYNEEFDGDKGLKSDIILLKIVDQYDRNSRSFLMGGKWVELTIENVVLTFGLPINGTYFIMNKTCTLKDGGVINTISPKLRRTRKYPLRRHWMIFL